MMQGEEASWGGFWLFILGIIPAKSLGILQTKKRRQGLEGEVSSLTSVLSSVPWPRMP